MSEQQEAMRRKGRPGDLIVHHASGNVRTLGRRKDDDSGWWLVEGGGLADGVYGWTVARRADVAVALLAFSAPSSASTREDTP